MSPTKGEHSIALQEVLDDLCMRFLVNLPESEYASFERLFFAVESAHWFYDDFYRESNSALPRLPLKHFAARLFANTELLSQYRDDAARLTAQFQLYKQEVPTCGAAILTPCMNKVLLVRGWGNNARWGFPKGKLSKDETELEAATREVFEEVGYDISPLVGGNTPFVDTMTSGRYSRIFIVTDVPEHTEFVTRTRKEISDIKWVPLAALPESPKAAKVLQGVMLTSTGKHHRESKLRNIFFSQYGVPQHAKRIRAWVKRHRKSLETLLQTNNEGAGTSETYNPGVHESPSCLERSEVDPVASLDNFLSLEEIEANLTPRGDKTEVDQSRRKSKATCGKGSVKSNFTASKDNNRKSRKVAVQKEDVRNRTTFGADSGFRLNESERERLFRQYVVETDRIAAEKGLQDDSWPVPIVTSKDFSEEQIREARQWASERARPESQGNPTFVNCHPPDSTHAPVSTISGQLDFTKPITCKLPCAQGREAAFVFDRVAIMESMKMPRSA